MLLSPKDLIGLSISQMATICSLTSGTWISVNLALAAAATSSIASVCSSLAHKSPSSLNGEVNPYKISIANNL